MSIYQSDKEAKRKLVALSFKDAADNPSFIQPYQEVADEVVALSQTTLTKQKMMPYVLDHKYELAVWKAITSAERWMKFLTQLHMNKVTVRDVTMIKQLIEGDFKLLLEDAEADGVVESGDKVQIIEGIHAITTYQGGRGLTARIELL